MPAPGTLGGGPAGGGGGPSFLGPLADTFAWLNPAPSNDYRSWQNPARRQAEQEQLFGGAEPATEEFDIEDLDGLDQGKLRLGLFIAAPEAGASDKPLPLLGLSPYDLGVQRGEGNNRGFNPQFSPNRAKGYIELDFENDTAYIQSNPTCERDGSDCEPAKDIAQDDIGNFTDRKSEVEPNDTDGDEVHISWEFSQAKGTKYLGPAAELVSGPSIDGDLHARAGPDGKPIVELGWWVSLNRAGRMPTTWRGSALVGLGKARQGKAPLAWPDQTLCATHCTSVRPRLWRAAGWIPSDQSSIVSCSSASAAKVAKEGVGLEGVTPEPGSGGGPSPANRRDPG